MITGAKDLKPKRLLGKQAKLENVSAKLELPCPARAEHDTKRTFGGLYG